MEVLVTLFILVLALLMFAGYRASKHGGDRSLDESVHELMRKQRNGGSGGGFAGG